MRSHVLTIVRTQSTHFWRLRRRKFLGKVGIGMMLAGVTGFVLIILSMSYGPTRADADVVIGAGGSMIALYSRDLAGAGICIVSAIIGFILFSINGSVLRD